MSSSSSWEWTSKRIAAVAVLSVCAAGAFFGWLWARSSVEAMEASRVREEEKLDRFKTHLEENYELFFGSEQEAEPPSPLLEKPLLSIVKDLATECGLDGRLARLVEEESAKSREMTAKISFKRVRMADVVNFLSVARKTYPGLRDREASMRHARGGEADVWDVDLSLTARKP